MSTQSTPRYVLAKYVPHLGRMEPLNIGVLVWWKGEFCAKFLAKDDVPVSDLDTYERWVDFWNLQMSEKAIRPRRGKPVAKKDPKCIDALLSTQKGNYMLVDSGELMQPLAENKLQDATEFLFAELVMDPSRKGKRAGKSHSGLASHCSDFLDRAGIDYKKHHPIKIDWDGVPHHLQPDYYIGNGTPDAIFQRADMSKEREINYSAFMVDSILKHDVIEKERCRFLIRSQDLNSRAAEAGMKLVESICAVIDVDGNMAVDEVRSLTSSGN